MILNISKLLHYQIFSHSSFLCKFVPFSTIIRSSRFCSELLYPFIRFSSIQLCTVVHTIKYRSSHTFVSAILFRHLCSPDRVRSLNIFCSFQYLLTITFNLFNYIFPWLPVHLLLFLQTFSFYYITLSPLHLSIFLFYLYIYLSYYPTFTSLLLTVLPLHLSILLSYLWAVALDLMLV